MKEINKVIAERFVNYVFDWDYKTYLLVGAYGSSKSYNTALKIIFKLFEEKRKCLVVREVYETLKESVLLLHLSLTFHIRLPLLSFVKVSLDFLFILEIVAFFIPEPLIVTSVVSDVTDVLFNSIVTFDVSFGQFVILLGLTLSDFKLKVAGVSSYTTTTFK